MMTSAATGSNVAAPPAAPPRGGRKSASLPAETVDYLKSWMMSPDHVAHPYPTEQEKAAIMADTGIELKQLTNWFVNNRKRYWKPRVGAGAAAAGPTAAAAGSGGSAMIATAAGAAAAASSSSSSLDLRHRRTQQANVDCRHDHQRAVAAPAEAAAAPYQGLDGMMMRRDGMIADADDDPHTISEGSGSSACDDSGDENDDDSYRSSEQRSRCSSMSASFDSPPPSSAQPRCDDDHSSPSSSSSSATTSVAMAEGYRRHEEVDVYVLRPEEGNHPASSSSSHPAVASAVAVGNGGGGAAEPLPTIRDLTIKSSVPKERILATFKCPISYTIPYDIENDKRRVQSRRDGEVLRAKKHYLKLYLASRGVVHVDAMAGGGATGLGDDPTDFDAAADVVAGAPPVVEHEASRPSTTSSSPLLAASPPIDDASSVPPRDACRDDGVSRVAPPPSRSRPSADPDGPGPPRPRKRARAAAPDDADEWRTLCRDARGGAFCDSLPGLEEASRMFGFSSP